MQFNTPFYFLVTVLVHFKCDAVIFNETFTRENLTLWNLSGFCIKRLQFFDGYWQSGSYNDNVQCSLISNKLTFSSSSEVSVKITLLKRMSCNLSSLVFKSKLVLIDSVQYKAYKSSFISYKDHLDKIELYFEFSVQPYTLDRFSLHLPHEVICGALSEVVINGKRPAYKEVVYFGYCSPKSRKNLYNETVYVVHSNDAQFPRYYGSCACSKRISSAQCFPCKSVEKRQKGQLQCLNCRHSKKISGVRSVKCFQAVKSSIRLRSVEHDTIFFDWILDSLFFVSRMSLTISDINNKKLKHTFTTDVTESNVFINNLDPGVTYHLKFDTLINDVVISSKIMNIKTPERHKFLTSDQITAVCCTVITLLFLLLFASCMVEKRSKDETSTATYDEQEVVMK